MADCSIRVRDFAISEPPQSPCSWADMESAREAAQTAPIGSFGHQFLGPFQCPRTSCSERSK
eukprot:2283560-Alexandrium_andersonii.AAC.1